ncbi:hypothetical protein DET59_10327 [Rossellomorea aquimaris]|uniref:Uncharacterized protein n=1 Tax=Rossellomorea aquimaris TaxID=189382 RepID=A0A366EU25_9BACI|nr:hypothetical protein DET59_10327 [Rossellomorea aquimaris]
MEIIALVIAGGAFSIVMILLEQNKKLEKRVKELENKV